jgi:hypothetical protein
MERVLCFKKIHKAIPMSLYLQMDSCTIEVWYYKNNKYR